MHHTHTHTWNVRRCLPLNTLTGRGGRWKIFFPTPPGKQLISHATQIRMSLYQTVCVSETRPKIPRVLRRTTNHAPPISRFPITSRFTWTPAIVLDPRTKGILVPPGRKNPEYMYTRDVVAEVVDEGSAQLRMIYRGEPRRNNATEFEAR